MAYQAIFKRYELKYLLTQSQKDHLLAAMAAHMAQDKYGRTLIRNLYFDTDSYRLIRRSLERPIYKEKLRLRSYGPPIPDAPVFVELKKKYRGVVYKRRLAMPEPAATDWICHGNGAPDCQIGREIDYFRSYYPGLHPTVYLSYEREAYYCRDGGDFRVTFDDRIRCRQDRLSLTQPADGTPILAEDLVLMELKTPGGIPLWMSHLLSELRIYKTSFSKYGTAYQQQILQGGASYAANIFPGSV